MADNTQGKKATAYIEEQQKKHQPLIHVNDSKEVLGARYGTSESTSLDQKIAWIKNITGQDAVISISPDSSDYDILKRRGETEAQVDFDQWLMNEYKLDDPTANPYVFNKIREKYKPFFDRRMAAVKEENEIRQKEASIRLNGVDSMEDMYYQYLKASDDLFAARVKAATDPLFKKGGNVQAELVNSMNWDWSALQQNMYKGLKMMNFDTRVSAPGFTESMAKQKEGKWKPVANP